jgi:tRNA-Thr(GGU) m(6)t(6)A37 methyltransferase TsaA
MITNKTYTLHTIGIIHSCFKEKFAIPRQPQLAPAATATLEMLPPYNKPEALEGLEQSSHIWLNFIFHEALAKDNEAPRLRVRPPRLGGNKKVGVFATRATHRPNPLGLSVVKLEKIVGSTLYLSGIDLLDGTPIVDIKPYIPYADALPHAHNHMAADVPEPIDVIFSSQALAQAEMAKQRLGQPVVELIQQMLKQDPKPAYQSPSAERIYGCKLWDINVTWRYIEPNCIQVEGVTPS